MTTPTPTPTPKPPTRAEQRAAAQAAAVLAARPYDGPHGAQGPVSWREIAPGKWKVSHADGRVVVVEQHGMTEAQALALMPEVKRPAAVPAGGAITGGVTTGGVSAPATDERAVPTA